MQERVQLLRRALPPGVHVHYAMKANPMPAVVAHLARLVDGIDVASVGELHVALDAGMGADAISFAGPGKSDAEVGQAVAAGITLNLESRRELEAAAAAGQRLRLRPRVAVRVNPEFELKSAGMRMGGAAKQFGVDAERVPELLGRIRELDLDFMGFHVFSGSQSLRADALIEAQAKTLDLACSLAVDAPAPVRSLNIGGGFGVPYFPGDSPLDVERVGAALATRMPELRKRLPQARVCVELGRYLVAEAGLYVCRVIDRKASRGQVFLVTDGGLHQHLAASGNFGQVIRKNYPLVVATRMSSTQREIANVVGPLCTPLDLLGDKVEIPPAEVGDLIAVLQSGAYGLTASPTAFLSHPPAREILV
jgi:diaminopimelate decarboxylase